MPITAAERFWPWGPLGMALIWHDLGIVEALVSQQKWKLASWFLLGMIADNFIRAAISAFSKPWTGAADQQGMIVVAVILLVLLVARAVAWMRQATPPNSN